METAVLGTRCTGGTVTTGMVHGGWCTQGVLVHVRVAVLVHVRVAVLVHVRLSVSAHVRLSVSAQSPVRVGSVWLSEVDPGSVRSILDVKCVILDVKCVILDVKCVIFLNNLRFRLIIAGFEQ